jgi:hypothetical protein
MNKSKPDDVFEGPGFTMKRYGRSIDIQTHRTPEQQAHLLKAIWESRPGLIQRAQSATDALCDLIRKYSSFDLVLHLWLQNSLFDPDNYKETESTQRPHFVEHATMLQLKDASPTVTGEIVVLPDDIVRASNLLGDIFQLTVEYYGAEAANPELSGSPPSALDELRRRTLLREMMIGPPAYTHHWLAVLEGLFGPPHISSYLTQACGFDLSDAFSCYRAVAALIDEILTERSRTARNSEEQIKKQLKEYMETGKFEGELEHKAMFDAIRNMRSKERKRSISSISRHWVTVALADVLSFTPATLASKAGVSEQNASQFLDAFSLPFGSTKADYVIPAPLPTVRVRPVINLGDKFLCPLPFNFIWAIKPRFEEALKQSNRWNSYQKHRGSFLVSEGLKSISKLLPGSQVYESLTYPIGPSERAELDALILFDRYVFLLEAKGGEFGAARRGGKEGIKRGLADLVGDPLEQGARAWDYIRKNEQPDFLAKDGKQVVLDKRRHTDISIITLTLDSLDVFTPEIHRLRETGVLGQHDLPWAVCLTDLMAVSEILQSPGEFTHFLRWRRAIGKAGDVSAGTDELNWLAIYLKEGPKLLKVPDGYSNLSFTSYTDDFDAFFLYEGGFRTQPASRPAQPIPASVRELLSATESSGIPGFTMVTETLLDLNFEEREQLAERLRQMSKERPGDPELFKLDTTSLSVRLIRGQRTPEQLQSKIDDSCPLHTRVLLIAMDFTPALRLFGWFVRDAVA